MSKRGASTALVPYVPPTTPDRASAGGGKYQRMDVIPYQGAPLTVQMMGTHTHSHGDDIADDESHDVAHTHYGPEYNLGSSPESVRHKFVQTGGAAGTWLGGSLGSLFGPEGTAVGSALGNRIGQAAGGFVYDGAAHVTRVVRDHLVKHVTNFAKDLQGRLMGYSHKLIRGASDMVRSAYSRGRQMSAHAVHRLKHRLAGLITNRGHALALAAHNVDPSIEDIANAWVVSHGHEQRHAAHHAMHDGHTHLPGFFENDIYSAMKTLSKRKRRGKKRTRGHKKKSAKRSRR